jgi:iron complex transport system substrate-binding protein
MFRKIAQIIAITATCSLAACNQPVEEKSQISTEPRIVSLSGAVSETLVALGMEEQIVGVDVTSTFPGSMQQRGIKPEQAAQLQQAGVKVWIIDQEYSINGTKKYISQLADSFGKQEAGKNLINTIDEQYAAIPQFEQKPRIMFIYARGAGALSVCGKDMPMATMIAMAGGVNAGDEFEGFKPLTAEAVVKSDPDAILLFESGIKSLDGPEGILQVPGVAQTKAGKNRNFIVMDGELLSGFGPRVAEAVIELSQKIHGAAPVAGAAAQ